MARRKSSSIDYGKPLVKSAKNASYSKIKPAVIDTSWLKSVTITNDGTFEFEESWTEFILTLLGMLYDAYQDYFLHQLVTNLVVSEHVSVEKEILYDLDEVNVSEVYRLRDTPYYIRLKFNGKSYYKAIDKLLDILKIDKKAIKFNIVPVNSLEYKTVKKEESLSDILKSINLDIDVKSISIYGIKQEVKSTQQAMVAFIAWASVGFEDDIIDACIKSNTSEVGIVEASKIDDYDTRFETIKFGEMYLYYTNNNKGSLRYIEEVAKRLGISTGLISMEYLKLERI